MNFASNREAQSHFLRADQKTEVSALHVGRMRSLFRLYGSTAISPIIHFLFFSIPPGFLSVTSQMKTTFHSLAWSPVTKFQPVWCETWCVQALGSVVKGTTLIFSSLSSYWQMHNWNSRIHLCCYETEAVPKMEDQEDRRSLGPWWPRSCPINFVPLACWTGLSHCYFRVFVLSAKSKPN